MTTGRVKRFAPHFVCITSLTLLVIMFVARDQYESGMLPLRLAVAHIEGAPGGWIDLDSLNQRYDVTTPVVPVNVIGPSLKRIQLDPLYPMYEPKGRPRTKSKVTLYDAGGKELQPSNDRTCPPLCYDLQTPWPLLAVAGVKPNGNAAPIKLDSDGYVTLSNEDIARIGREVARVLKENR